MSLVSALLRVLPSSSKFSFTSFPESITKIVMGFLAILGGLKQTLPSLMTVGYCQEACEFA